MDYTPLRQSPPRDNFEIPIYDQSHDQSLPGLCDIGVRPVEISVGSLDTAHVSQSSSGNTDVWLFSTTWLYDEITEMVFALASGS